MAEAKIAKHKIKRATLISQQQRIQDFVNNKLSTASIHEVELRVRALEKYFHDFENVQSVIEEYETGEEASTIRGTFEELYFTLHPALSASIDQLKHERVNESNNLPTGSSSLKLPKISLPFFSGDYTQWITYYDTFTALVHKNSALDDITRFHYLRSSLKDGALRRIESVDVTAENYEVALKLLTDRYQKKPLIIREHVRHLLNLATITKVSASTLRDLIDTVSVHLRALKSLGRPVAQWDDILVEIILSKLDNSTLDKWNDEATTDRLPTLDELTTFLEKRCNHLEERLSNRQQSNISSNAVKQVPHKQVRTSLAVSENTIYQKKCSYCKGLNHLIYRCRKFLTLAPKQRFDAIHERNLCNNCLKSGHTHQSCEAEKCKECKSLHHTLLHYNTFYVNKSQPSTTQPLASQPSASRPSTSSNSQSA